VKEKDFSAYGAQLFKSGLQTPILRYLRDYRGKGHRKATLWSFIIIILKLHHEKVSPILM